MNSVSVAVVAGAATDTGTGKLLPAIKLATDKEEQQKGGEVLTTVTPVVIIKASESSEESPVISLQNGGLSTTGATPALKGNNIMSSAETGAVAVENGGGVAGAMDSLETGVAKVAINGTNQNRMIRVSQY